jgi:hypothetical protein
MTGERDPLLDAWDKTRLELARSDASLWRARELLLEWAALTETPPTDDAIDLLRRQDRLLLETRTFLIETPDVVQIPVAGSGDGSGEAPDPGPAAA